MQAGNFMGIWRRGKRIEEEKGRSTEVTPEISTHFPDWLYIVYLTRKEGEKERRRDSAVSVQ